MFNYFNRTLLTAQLHKAVSTLYFGYRIYARGSSYHSLNLIEVISKALEESKEISEIIKKYDKEVPMGQWNWKKDADIALQYCEWIKNGTWPKETGGFPTNLNGIIFKKK
ncbi:hypothetical protein SDC9_190858 [bioreactor metagenome]|uniref:Uncharacterized protein n=1 Tax=bioreactor metagenome TaxID=1076179 RepID=A0A645HYN5_9ZZZZ